AIVRSVIDLARNLGLSVVAEGVETAAAWEYLRAAGCDLSQGWHLGRPMAPDAFQAWLDRRRVRAA
ncbi:MAG TPA: EAL domain-containing protein, partial [Acidimicrobiales bacterium]|nr:EAL domain-containing protein [Acidimicrobiales bacterium]